MIARRVVRSLLAAIAVASCAPGRDAPPAPDLEFLVLAGDSTFWVRHENDRLKVRGSPIQLARVDGRLVEIYVADDDRSFQGAILVGQRIYRRDLLTGDSAVVFDDTTITSLARWYAHMHPRERRLTPTEQPDAEPHVDVLGEVVTIDQHGPFLSFEYRVDGTLEGTNELHEVRRGVVDLRDGTPATLAELFGDSAAAQLVAEGARRLSNTLDSVIASGDERAREAIPALPGLSFDPGSFTMTAIGREPAVEFAVIGTGPETGGIVLPLEPIRAPVPPWWSEVRSTLPVVSGDSLTDVWSRNTLAVLLQYGPEGDRADLIVRDTVGRQDWRLASIPAPAYRLFWLDAAADSAYRDALVRAFDEAALYSEEARTALRPVPRPAPAAAVTRSASFP